MFLFPPTPSTVSFFGVTSKHCPAQSSSAGSQTHRLCEYTLPSLTRFQLWSQVRFQE